MADSLIVLLTTTMMYIHTKYQSEKNQPMSLRSVNRVCSKRSTEAGDSLCICPTHKVLQLVIFSMKLCLRLQSQNLDRRK